MEELYQIDTKYGVCGLVAVAGVVTSAAPMIKWSIAKPLEDVVAWCKLHGYSFTRIN